MAEGESQIKILEDEDRSRHAATPDLSVSVLSDGESTIFKRRAIRKHLDTGEIEHIEWLVCELNGVRIYALGNSIIMTTQDLNP